MNKYVFSWDVITKFDKTYTVHIPFQCKNLDSFIDKIVDRIRNSPMKMTLVFGCCVSESDIYRFDENFLTLDDWFVKYKNK